MTCKYHRVAPLAGDDPRLEDPALQDLVAFVGYRPNALLTMAKLPGLLPAVLGMVQAALRQIIRALPKDRNQYIISFSSVRDAALANEGAELTAMGLQMIGGRPVVLDGNRIDSPAEHNFILVALPHELAHFADLNVLVLTREEAKFRPQRDSGQIVLVLDVAAPRVHVASNENLATRLAV